MQPGPQRDPQRPRSRAHEKKDRARTVIPDVSDLDVPSPESGMHLSAAQKKIWKSLWTSGQATQWGAGDVHAVAMLSILLDKLYSGSVTRDELTEIRNLRNELGLSPAARDRLGWEVAADGLQG